MKGIGEAPPELTPGPFDVVFCNGVLMYCDNAREMLGALTQVAQRPGASGAAVAHFST